MFFFFNFVKEGLRIEMGEGSNEETGRVGSERDKEQGRP